MLDNFPILLQPATGFNKKIKILQTTRLKYNGEKFSLASHIGDDIDNVLTNRKLMQSYLPSEPIFLNQIHSNICIDLDNQNILLDADAAITNKKLFPLVIQTADCLPIILAAADGTSIAAIHAGWKGLLNGIIQNTISMMDKNKKYNAFIGPHICDKCFEVGDDVYKKFTQQDTRYRDFFILNKNNKYQANLAQIATLILNTNNIATIINNNICTKCQNNWFFSYRLDNNLGRIATFVWIE